MHFVSLVCSKRRKGNSDLLGRLALKVALEKGADSGEVVYLDEFAIEQCQGCMACVFKEVPCKLEDDLYSFLDKISQADVLFLTAPIYVLTIPGSLKLVMDRYLAMYKGIKEHYGRPAVSVGIAGPRDWGQFQVPLMNLSLLAFGFEVLDSFVAYGAGPGETLLDDEAISRLQNRVEDLLTYQHQPFESQLSKHCPVCFSTLFERVEGKRYRCSVCAVEAEERPDGFYFTADSLNDHRWTQKNIEDHYRDWILRTKDTFRERLRSIMKKKKELGLGV